MLLSKYNLIMDDMKQKREKEGRKLESYNFLLLREDVCCSSFLRNVVVLRLSVRNHAMV